MTALAADRVYGSKRQPSYFSAAGAAAYSTWLRFRKVTLATWASGSMAPLQPNSSVQSFCEARWP